MKITELVGSGDKIVLRTLPFLAIGLVLNFLFPSFFSVGGPSTIVKAIALILLVLGLAVWISSVALILTRAPRHELITTGPYALVRHPIYTGVALLVLPSAGLLLNSWLGVPIGIVMYAASRRFSPDEEKALSRAFGASWDEYRRRVKIPWL